MMLGQTTATDGQTACDMPFCMVIDGAFFTPQGAVVSGKVETGTLHPGDTVEIVGRLGRREATVRVIEHFNARIDEASPGLCVGVILDGLTRDDQARVDKGDRLCAMRSG